MIASKLGKKIQLFLLIFTYYFFDRYSFRINSWWVRFYGKRVFHWPRQNSRPAISRIWLYKMSLVLSIEFEQGRKMLLVCFLTFFTILNPFWLIDGSLVHHPDFTMIMINLHISKRDLNDQNDCLSNSFIYLVSSN